jgi:hypothetical protein
MLQGLAYAGLIEIKWKEIQEKVNEIMDSEYIVVSKGNGVNRDPTVLVIVLNIRNEGSELLKVRFSFF